MNDFSDMTPKQHVFDSLRKLISWIDGGWDMNENREQLKRSLENILSWESEIANMPNVPVEGRALSARPSRMQG